MTAVLIMTTRRGLSRGTGGTCAGGGGIMEAHRGIIKVNQGVREEVCATTDKIIFIPTQKPQAQGGARFSAFHAPPCANFLRFLSAINFGAPLARLVKTTIFFKLQAGVSLVSSAPPPLLPRPAPRPCHTQNQPFKIILIGVKLVPS